MSAGDCTTNMAPGNHPKRSTESPGYTAHTPADLPIQDLVLRTIRELLACDLTIVAVADALSMNVRTLQRRLAEAGVSYRTLLNDCRQEQAKAHLSRCDLPVSEVSRRLGYSDPAHFVRAFRRWTGVTPTRYGCKRRKSRQ